ncbi:MAG: hypothetical protein LBT12_01650 [Oscillospiraceae bacterium]|nr:hypothetical protein [Oscillospiraceae bacterium]
MEIKTKKQKLGGKMMNKKILLGVTATVLVLALAIGGTLMLFSAQTATATNVVTLGKGIAAGLYERGGTTEPEDNDEFKLITDSNTGINFQTVTPNAIIYKEPRIQRSDVGGSDAYVRVIATVNIWAPSDDDTAASYEVIDELGYVPASKLTNDQNALVNKILQSADRDENWEFVNTSPVSNTGTYYYVTGGENGTLKVLSAPNNASTPSVTDTIFTEIQIPNVKTGADGSDALKELNAFLALGGYKITVDLQAQLIQVENNDGYTGTETGSDNWKKAFEQFEA